MAIRFGTYTEFQSPPNGNHAQIIWDHIAVGEQADRLGFDVFTCLEHDWFEQFAIMPDPLQLFALMSQRTRNIRFRALCQMVNDEPFAHGRGDRHSGIEGAEWILKHDLHLTPQPAECLATECTHVDAGEGDAASGRFDEPEHGATGGRLAASALTDEGERLAGVDVEADAIHCAHCALRAAEESPTDGEVHGQIAYAEQGCIVANDSHFALGLRAHVRLGGAHRSDPASAVPTAASGTCGRARRSGSTAR